MRIHFESDVFALNHMVPNNALLEVLRVTENGIRVQQYAWASSLNGENLHYTILFWGVEINWMDRVVRNRPTIFAADLSVS